ncbi:MAG: endonuclease [Methylomonas sp.]|nr:MAG: endonuclease [Methylomonas sp.]
MQADWSVYIIRCSDDSLYTGISTDVERRFRQHSMGCGAKYFRRCRPERIVYIESGHSRSSAGRRELAIKALSKREKLWLIMRVSQSI